MVAFQIIHMTLQSLCVMMNDFKSWTHFWILYNMKDGLNIVKIAFGMFSKEALISGSQKIFFSSKSVICSPLSVVVLLRQHMPCLIQICASEIRQHDLLSFLGLYGLCMQKQVSWETAFERSFFLVVPLTSQYRQYCHLHQVLCCDVSVQQSHYLDETN